MERKYAEVPQSLRITELEEANTQLRTELAAAHTKVAEVEHHERTLSSDYDGLRKDFDDLRTSYAAIVQEKVNLEKTEHEKVQRSQNLLRKKLVELQRDTEESVAALKGGAWIFPLRTLLSPPCLTGSRQRFGRCLQPLPNAMKISPPSRWLVFSRCLWGVVRTFVAAQEIGSIL
jgi:predicted metallo-beta-lactamase superfamily hydrolase